MLSRARMSCVALEPVNGSEPPVEAWFGPPDEEEGVVEPCPVAVTVAGGVDVGVVGVVTVDPVELITTGGVAMLNPALSTNCIRNIQVLPTPQLYVPSTWPASPVGGYGARRPVSDHDDGLEQSALHTHPT
jgi:hypothetical protein